MLILRYIILFFIVFSSNSCHHSKKRDFFTTIKHLSFSPINGKIFYLSDLKTKATVIVMRERDCPIAEKYGPRLALLEEKYSKKGVKFIFNYVGQVRANQNARKDLKKFNFKSSYVIDKDQKIINALGAETTGDVFILNSKLQKVYGGPVDDQFHLLKSAIKAKNHYVRDILERLISDKKVTYQKLPAPGCFISKPIKIKKKSILKM